MSLREFFSGDEVDRYEREMKRERQFQNKLDDAVTRFRRRGRQLIAAGKMTALRQAYIEAVVGPAMESDDRELEVIREVDGQLRELLAELEVDPYEGHFSDI